MRSATPEAIPLAPRSGAPPSATVAGPEVPLACFGLGVVLPLLGGGNVLFQLEPAVATPLLLAASAGFAALVAVRGAKSVPPAAWQRTETAALLLLVAWWLGNLCLRPSGPRAMVDAQGLVAAALLFLALARRPLRDGALERFAVGLAAGALITALYGQYQYWVMFPAIEPAMRELYGQGPFLSVNANFYSANCYAPFLAATLVLLAGLALQGRQVFPWLAAPPLLVTLVLSESRATVALLAAVALALVARSRLQPRQRRLVLAALAVAVPVGLWIGSRWLAPDELWETALLGRLAIWRGAWAMIGDHWLLGVGLGRFAEYFPAYQVTDFFTRYPHNLLLEALAETGVVGLLALSTFLAAAFVTSFRSVAASGSILRRSAFAAAALLLVHAMVDIDWRAPANPILLMVLLAVSRHPAPEAAC